MLRPVLFVLLAVYLTSAQAVLVQTPESVTEGESATLYSIDDAQIQSVKLFYRQAGSRHFVQQILNQKGSVWSVVFDKNQLRAPGLEYYVELRFKNGKTSTDPPRYPKYNPIRLSVKAKTEIVITMENNLIEPGQDLEFRVKGHVDAAARVEIGDVDVTYLVQRHDEKWVLKNDSNVFLGDEVLNIVSAEGKLLATQALTIRDEAESLQQKELVLRGNASLNVGGQSSTNDSDDPATLSGNLHVETEYSDGDFKSHFSGVNVKYQHNAEEEFNLSSGFVFSNSYKNHNLDIGDVSVSGTPLVMSGFSRRGMVASTENETFSGSFFNVRTSTVEGWESGISFDDRQTYGIALDQKLGAEYKTRIQLSAVSGELKEPESVNVGSINSTAQSGDSAGVQVTTEMAGVSIDAQLAASSFDSDTTDTVSAKSDEAYELNLSREAFGLASSLGYHQYGANYATIANPNFSNNREGLNLSVGSGWRFLNWSASLATTKDNVDKDPAQSIVTSNNTGLNLSFIFESWPSIDLGFNFNDQSSSDEPALDQRIDNEGYDYMLGLSDNLGPYNLAWSSSKGRINNNLDPTNDSETLNHSLTVGVNADVVDISLNVSQNKTRANNELTSNLANLSANFPLFSDKVMLNSQISVQQNSADDNSQDNKIVGGSARVSWTLGDMIKTSTAFWSKAQFGLSWTYNKNSDRLNSSTDTSDEIIMLEFSLGAPVSFENRWQF